jgi:4-amino-4-deoxy-L-arabinose transferase-like glycosyltransferase
MSVSDGAGRIVTRSHRGRMIGQALAVTAIVTALYAWDLSLSPPHLLHDEIKFALQAKAMADTGRDLNGRLLPVYFQEPGFAVGRDPLCVYVTAAFLTALPLGESTIRLPSAVVGAVGVGLVFVLAHATFGSAPMAWLTAMVMALTPTYFIHSRLALSVIYPVPFVVAWLWALARYQTSRRRSDAVACGAILGLGFYSYLGGAVMMPLYLAMTVAVMALSGDRRAWMATLAAFAVTLVPLVAWQAIEPDRYANILSAYRLYDQAQMSPLAKVRALLRPSNLLERVDIYWDTFNPSRLFFTGESSLNISTRLVGTYLLPMACFLAVGVHEVLRRQRSAFNLVLLGGLLTAPLPAVLMQDVEIRRWLVVIPFATMIGAVGIRRLLRGNRLQQALCVLMLAAMPLQFAGFARDYFGPYRERAAFWFGGNIRGALEEVLRESAAQPDTAVYISSDIPWVEAYWRFYTTVHDRRSILARTTYVALHAGELVPAPAGSLLVAPATDPSLPPLLLSAGWEAMRTLDDVDGKPSLAIYTTPGSR